MFSLFKYYDIIEMEEKYADKFSALNKTRKISILPPIFRKQGRKLVLAYMVISQPKYIDNHAIITRPIGFIFKDRITRKILSIQCCSDYDFVPSRFDFEFEYYNLETHEEYWPNRSAENEERYRLALELLHRANKSVTFWGKINQKAYSEYIETIKTFFPKKYWFFYEQLEVNEIVKVDEQIINAREIAKKEHKEKMKVLQAKIKAEHKIAHEELVQDMKKKVIVYVRDEVLPTLKHKGDATRILFYNELGKIFKNFCNDKDCKNCYDSTLTEKSRQKNREKLLEEIKIEIIKRFSRACVTPLNSFKSICDCCKTMIIFLNTMILEEIHGAVTEKSKATIKKCIKTINANMPKISNNNARQQIGDLAELLCKDYYEVTNENDLSFLYIGYSTINKYQR